MIALAAAAILAASSPGAAYSNLPADLKAAADAYDQAQIHGDRAALERLVADDYTLISGGAQVETKAQLIADFTAPDFKLNPYVVTEPIQKVWSDGAVLGGLVLFAGSDGGKAFSTHMRFADVWARRDGQWRLVFTGVTRVPGG